VFGWRGNGDGAQDGTETVVGGAAETDRSAEYLATIDALSTVNAPMPGTVLAPGQFETAIAGTLEAFEATSESLRSSETPTPTETPTPSATSTATAEFYYVSPTATQRRPEPTPIPPTITPVPTKKKCLIGAEPDHPLYCTPTPSP
jgi:hypothetical protein